MRLEDRRRTVLPIQTLIVALLVVAVTPAARAANVNVEVSSNFFLPGTVTIRVGDTVTWRNDGAIHNVNADDGSFRCAQGCDDTGGNGNATGGLWTATRTFTQPGTIGYHCQVHGFAMPGTIVVQPAEGGGDDQPGNVRFSQGAYSVSEGGGSATITVLRASGDDGPATVAFTASAGSAAVGADFTGVTGTLSWADGDDANKTFQVPIVNDAVDESNETINLTLSNATGATLGTPATAALTIQDNDGTGGPAGPPTVPGNLRADGQSTTEILLTWNDSSNETGYRIERRLLRGGAFQEVAAAPANATSFLAGGLDPETPYLFRIRAESGSTLSGFSNEAQGSTFAVAAPCVPSATALCVSGERFKIEVDWRTPAGATGLGTAVPVDSAPSSGLFYFFSADNLELLVKVLNACGFPDSPRYWVFFAATTNVEFMLAGDRHPERPHQVLLQPAEPGGAADPGHGRVRHLPVR